MSFAETVNFGVELETHVPQDREIPIGGYHNGLAQSWLPVGWKAERDASIECPRTRRKCEFVSPVLKGQDGLQQIDVACEKITEKGGRVNASCGVHVTLSFDGDAAALARLITLVANHEKALYASTGSRNREEASHRHCWCSSVKKYGSHKQAKDNLDHNRYHLLNLTHMARGRNRVEFRVFSGSLNADKIKAWVQLCIALVEQAMKTKRCNSWAYTKRGTGRAKWERENAGEGETELRRLFYRIGWFRGNRTAAGRENPAGLINEIDRQTCVDTLLRMARKYDQS